MRPIAHPRLRLALLGTCGVSLAAALLAFCLAFTVPSPSRSLRPVLPAVDSLYTPVYVSMTAAGLLILSAVVAIASCLHGNRPIDLAACGGFLGVLVLSLTSLGLVATGKSAAQTGLEASLTSSLKAYGPSNASLYKAWDDMQTDLACCGVRTNLAQDSYQDTPWYRLMREGNPHSAPKIPNACCSASVRSSPSQLADCTSNLPSVPAQNPNMHRVGCFEAAMLLTEAFTVRYIILSVILLAASAGTLAIANWHLVLLSRQQLSSRGEDSQSSGKKSAQGAASSSGYVNFAGSLGSLRSTALAPSIVVGSSLASGHLGRRSPATSVYNGGGQKSAGSAARASSPAGSAARASSTAGSAARASSPAGSAARASSTAASSRTASPAQPISGGSQSALSSKPAALAPAKATALTAQPIRGSGRQRQPQPLANQKRPVHPQQQSLANQRRPVHPQPQSLANQKRPPQPQQPLPPLPHETPQPQPQQLHQQQQQQRQTVTPQTGKRESHF